ncbi:FecR family protein [Saccharicrinis sp. FJH54]|uniref:FecR family protein n=1 Tax=Saccharicrinis sp. FJH54 TaxID=3344665 RepID=UPI0035D4B8C7
MNQDKQHNIPVGLFIRVLTNEASTDEKRELEDLLKTSDSVRKEFSSFEMVWNMSAETHPEESIDVDAEWSILRNRISSQGKVISFRRFVQIAASIIVILGLGYLGWSQLGITRIESGLARMENIKLPDGSTVSLNAESKLSYARGFGSKNRNIKMEGEGFFEVTKNKALPFIISANEASVKVVGTKFNVKAYKNDPDIKVTVVEGVVELYNREKPQVKTRIKAGESGSYKSKSDTLLLHPNADLNDIAWKTLTMKFENETLENVCKVLRNTYHYDFSITEKVKDCTITVEFQDQDLGSVLKVLKSTLNLKMQQQGKHIQISGEGCPEIKP